MSLLSIVRKHTLPIFAAGIAALALFSYLPALSNGFTNWDDDLYVTNNDDIKTLSWNSVKHVLTSSHMGLYKPVVMLSFMLEYRFCGLSPFLYHLDNVILHVLNSLLVLWLIRLIAGNGPAAYIAGCIFAVHPAHVESVAWVSERKDMFYAFFFLLSCVLYIFYLKKRSPVHYILAVLCFLLSLVSKPMGIMLPFVLLLTDWKIKRPVSLIALIDKIPFFAASTAVICAAHLALKDAAPLATKISGYFADTASGTFTVSYILLFYAGKLFFPIGLSCLYPTPGSPDMIYPVIFSAISAGVLYLAWKHRGILFAAAFFLLTLFPVLQFVPTGQSIVADRYLYLPSVAFAYLIGSGMARALASHGPVRLCSIAVISLLIPVLSFASFSRCGVWKNSITLWSDVLRHYPDMPVALFNRGAAYLELMEPDKAIADLQRLADMGGSSPALYLNMGQAYLVKNEYRGAISCFDKAIQADGSIFEAYHLRALCLIRLGDECGAITDLNRALELKPDVPEVKFIRDKLVQNNQRQVLPEAVIPPGPSSP